MKELEDLKQWVLQDSRRFVKINTDKSILSGKWEVVLFSNDEDFVMECSEDLSEAILKALDRAW